MNRQRHILLLLFIVNAIVIATSSCSTQKNNARTRWWHSFNAKYNTYYNGSVAYIEGSLAKENGNKDNYTEIIPLYTVGNKASLELGKSNFETAVTKAQKAINQHSIKARPEWKKNRKKTERDLEWLSRREYNPFIWKAWMLMGRSQFHKGAFDEAAATFSYMSRLYRTQPAIYGKARAWLAKCYIEQDLMYDAEDVIRNMKRDSIDWRAQKEWDYTLADYYLHTENYAEAENYLKKVIRHEMRSKQRARELFLLGQILAAQNKNNEAYKAFKRVVRSNPPYETEFNARIAMTEVMPQGHAKQKISRLRAMARSDKNKDYLDQVSYAIGNIYLAEKDTLKAIGAYENGNTKATRSGIEKGVLLLHLGDLYWQMEKFGDARRCYGEAIGLLDKERPDYPLLSERSKILDELAPHTDNIHLQDSLQELAKMSEKDRNAAIDRVIDALKKKEKEERLNKLEQQGEQQRGQGDTSRPNQSRPSAPQPLGNSQGQWYFYSPTAVQQGKQAFQKLWGKRENADHWQRNNKTVVAMDTQEDLYGSETEQSDSLNTTNTEAEADGKQKADTAALDPHKREYYLAQIPFTEEQVAASNEIIKDALFNAGIIFKDKLDNLRLSEKYLRRLNNTFPDFEKTDEVYYHLFLLYSREGKKATASQFHDLLADRYPESEWTAIVNDPYFEENARYGTHREDSLYADTYNAFRENNFSTVARNVQMSEQRYPRGAHRDKFLFINGLTRLNMGDADSCVHTMERVVTDYPQSEVSAMAGMIINGVKSGKKLRGAQFDIANIWDYRTSVLEETDTTEQKLSDDPNQEFVFLMTYAPDSLNENQLLFELARYNFTSYMVRNFDIDIEDFQGMHRLTVSGFMNHDEALLYTRELYKNRRLMQLAQGSRNIIIAKSDVAKLGEQFSYNEYDTFYSEHFAPLPKPERPLLIEPVIPAEMYIPEDIPVPGTVKAPAEQTEQNDALDTFDVPSGNNEVIDDLYIIDEPQPSKSNATPETSNDIIIETPVEQKVSTPVATKEQKVNTPVAKEQKVNTPAVKKEQKVNTPAVKKEQKENTPAVKKTGNGTVRQDINSDILEIIDDTAPKTAAPAKKKEEKKQDKKDDEYFDFEGF